MPVYAYECTACKKEFDHLAKSMDDRNAKVPCPACGSRATARKMSMVAVGAASTGSNAVSERPSGGMCGCGRIPGSCGMN